MKVNDVVFLYIKGQRKSEPLNQGGMNLAEIYSAEKQIRCKQNTAIYDSNLYYFCHFIHFAESLTCTTSTGSFY